MNFLKIKYYNIINNLIKTYLKIKGYIFFLYEFFFPLKKSLLPIDVIITVHPKDFDKLENCIIGVKKNILHDINKLFLIGPNDKKLIKIAKKFSCNFINEDELLNKKDLRINYIYNGVDRSGWLYQQLLNYKAVITLGDEKFKLAINSDTIFCKKQRFEKNKKIIFNVCDSYYLPHLLVAKKILNLEKFSYISFTSHHIIYNKLILNEMVSLIEDRFKSKWYRAILNNLDYWEHSNHSEFETYAQYVLTNHRNDVKIEYWFNKTVFLKDQNNIENIFDCFFYKSISFHSWINRNK